MTTEALRGFPKTIQVALREGKWDYATRLFKEEKNAEHVKNDSWDLIPVITEHLTEENKCENNELYKCCVNLLTIISENSNSEEALLQFISEIEEAKENSKFVILLELLHKVVARIPSKKVNSFAWSFNAIQTYLGNLEMPNYDNLEGKERLLIDNDEPARNITRLYNEVIVFYGNFINIMNKNNDPEVRAVLCKFLVQLLGVPLCYLTMEIFHETIKSDGRVIAEIIVQKVFKTISDPFKLTEMRFEKLSDELIKPDTLSIAILFYMVYYEGVCFEVVPKVYNSRYIFESTLPLMCVLMEQNNVILTEKALKLSHSIFNPIKGQSLSYLLLDCEDHSKFCKALTNVIVHHDSEIIRKISLDVFTHYLKCFEIRGAYLIICNLVGLVSHSGLIGYIITFYKDLLSEEFNTNEDNMSEYFKGPKLYALLRKFCHLHENEETNIKENADQIISSLNLLRYLALRDMKNVTKFWDFAPTLEEIYFEPLRKAIELSKAHYELEINNLQKEDSAKQDKEVDELITINRKEIPKMTIEEKVQVLSAALTVFDVINSLLCRVTELIENKTRSM